MALSNLKKLLSGELEEEINRRMQPILEELKNIRKIQEQQLQVLKEILDKLG